MPYTRPWRGSSNVSNSGLTTPGKESAIRPTLPSSLSLLQVGLCHAQARSRRNPRRASVPRLQKSATTPFFRTHVPSPILLLSTSLFWHLCFCRERDHRELLPSSRKQPCDSSITMAEMAATIICNPRALQRRGDRQQRPRSGYRYGNHWCGMSISVSALM
jgi:hypothetical protein